MPYTLTIEDNGIEDILRSFEQGVPLTDIEKTILSCLVRKGMQSEEGTEKAFHELFRSIADDVPITKLHSIRAWRRHTGLSLLECKNYIEDNYYRK